MKTPNSIKDIITGRSSLENWLKKNYEEFYEYLCNNYSWTNDYKAKVYCYYNNINEQPKCELCGKPTKFQSTGYGYARFCGTKCSRNSEISQERWKQTNIERYGEDYAKVTNSKGTQTKIKKYGSGGYNNPEKYKQTMFERYGVDNPMKSIDIQNKVKKTMLERYGYEYNFLDPNMRNRMKEKPIHHYKDVIKVLDNGDFVCTCPDPECNKCEEKLYQISYNNYYQRKFIYKRCPCTIKYPLNNLPANNNNTNIEKIVRNILDKYNIDYQTNVRNIIYPYELDIYIPSKNIAIECNGTYWHCDKVVEISKHYDKYKLCLDNNIQLLTIWEDQLINKVDIIESIILSKLGIYDTRIYARQCIIKEVPSKVCSDFIESYHLQGKTNSSIRLGLYYNDELVSVMTFGKGRKCLNSNTTYELYRYCCKSGFQVVGGASKLFKHFIKVYNPNQIESFSSNDISNGDLYKQLGFEYVSNSIGYWYIGPHKQRYHRYKFRKQELIKEGFDKDKTEFEIMDERGFFRIYDSGQSKYIYKRNE